MDELSIYKRAFAAISRTSLDEVLSAMSLGRIARILTAGVAVFGAAVAAARAGVFLHEAGGHLAVGALLGAPPEYLQVTLVGGGQAGSAWAAPPGPWGSAAYSLAGIAVQTIVGIWIALGLRRRVPGGARDLFLRVLAAGCVTGGVHYLVVGGYYRVGDPAPWPWVWPPTLALAAPACALGARPLGRWIGARAGPAEAGAWARIGAFVAVSMIAGAGYLGLFQLLRQDDDHAANEQRHERLEQAISIAREAQAERLSAERATAAEALAAQGKPVPDALRAPVRPEDVEIAPEDVKRPFPIEVPLGACYLVAAVLAARGKPGVASPIGPRDALAALAIGAAALVAVSPISHGVAL